MDNAPIFTSTSQEKRKGIVCSISSPIIRTFFLTKHALASAGIVKEDQRFQKIKDFKDKHLGERVFIVATGPSLTMKDLNKLKTENTISMNSIVNVFSKTDYRPTYYMCSDKLVYDKIPHAQTLIDPERVFIGIGNVNTKWNISLENVRNCEDKDINLFHVDRTKTLKYIYYHKNDFQTRFSFDSSKEIVDGGTITFCALQMAVYMGFKQIYLLGADCNYLGNKVHFDENDNASKAKNEMMALFAMYQQKCAYTCALESTRHTDVSIFNATRGGKLEVFPRVDFDALF